MTNPLTQVNQAILNDPHGSVARQASHWLALNVMGYGQLTSDGASYYYYEDTSPRIAAPHKGRWPFTDGSTPWSPFTDANHAWMLVTHCKQTPMIIRQHVYEVGISKLIECHTGGLLTNEEMKGWLENE